MSQSAPHTRESNVIYSHNAPLFSLIVIFRFYCFYDAPKRTKVFPRYTAVLRKVVQLKSIEAYATIPKGMMGCGCLLHVASSEFTSF